MHSAKKGGTNFSQRMAIRRETRTRLSDFEKENLCHVCHTNLM